MLQSAGELSLGGEPRIDSFPGQKYVVENGLASDARRHPHLVEVPLRLLGISRIARSELAAMFELGRPTFSETAVAGMESHEIVRI